jgi:hypothetical protein
MAKSHESCKDHSHMHEVSMIKHSTLPMSIATRDPIIALGFRTMFPAGSSGPISPQGQISATTAVWTNFPTFNASLPLYAMPSNLGCSSMMLSKTVVSLIRLNLQSLFASSSQSILPSMNDKTMTRSHPRFFRKIQLVPNLHSALTSPIPQTS